jgi:hypothetical protein
MLAILIKPVRDNCGWWHMVGEHVAPVSMTRRAEFDARLLINVLFENGAHGVLFSDEIQTEISICGSQFNGPAGKGLNPPNDGPKGEKARIWPYP